MDGSDSFVSKPYSIRAAAGDAQSMRHVARDAGQVERLQLAVDRDALFELTHLREPQAITQLELADKHDLELPIGASERIRTSSRNCCDRHCASSINTTAKACSGTSVPRNS